MCHYNLMLDWECELASLCILLMIRSFVLLQAQASLWSHGNGNVNALFRNWGTENLWKWIKEGVMNSCGLLMSHVLGDNKEVFGPDLYNWASLWP